MEKWLEKTASYVALHQEAFLMALGIVLLAVLFNGLVVRVFFRGLRIFMSQTEAGTYESLVHSFRKPLRIFVFIAGVWGASECLPMSPGAHEVFLKFLKVSFILAAAYGGFHLEGVLSAVFRKVNHRMNLQTSDLVEQFLMRVIRCIVAVLAVAMLAETFGINAGGVVAGLGLAGLAVAMAAQSTLSNIFAGLALILDKPFDVGDRILVDTLDGLVEDINFRSTKIRLLTQELVSIPNSVVAGTFVTNCTRRDQRKTDIRLELAMGAKPEELKRLISDVTQYAQAHEWIDETTVLVRISEYTIAGPVMDITYMVRTAEWEDYVRIRQDVLFAFMEILEQHPLSMAQPMLRAGSVALQR